MTRRKFLSGTILLLLGGVFVAYRSYDSRFGIRVRRKLSKLFPPKPERIARVLQSQLSHLVIPVETASAYAEAMSAAGLEVPLPHDEEELKTFLLSTDFVQSRCDESRPLQFVGLYWPYRFPCYNPFSIARMS